MSYYIRKNHKTSYEELESDLDDQDLSENSDDEDFDIIESENLAVIADEDDDFPYLEDVPNQVRFLIVVKSIRNLRKKVYIFNLKKKCTFFS